MTNGWVTVMSHTHRPRRWVIAMSVLRSAVSVVSVVSLYYVLPLHGVQHVSDLVRVMIGFVIFVGLCALQLRSIARSSYPIARAFETLAVITPLFLVSFAAMYFEMQRSNGGSFSTSLSRTDALYFCVTVFATVGFGDIVAVSQTARVAVTVQMILDLVVIGIFVRTVVTVAQRARQERLGGSPVDAPRREPAPP